MDRKLGSRRIAGLSGMALAVALCAPVPAIAQAQTHQFNIPAQPLDSALRAFARTSRQQILFDRSLVRGRRTAGLVGAYGVDAGLAQLLAGSGLSASRGSRGAFVIRAAPGESEAGSAAAETGSADGAGTPEILVIGNPSQNVDIQRTEDDPQPYVVFERQQIEDSGATSVEDFLRTRLPMNTQAGSAAQEAGGTGAAIGSNISAINLRGLGINQTLVLIDGRRVPRTQTGGDFTQGDLNGLSLSSIERIEVLPSTAGGIYGGNAIGGVINIIRRRDYDGLQLTAGYDGTFRGGGEAFRIGLDGGFNFNDGRTSVTFSLSRAASNPLYVADNSLWARGRALYLANMPVNFALQGATPNIYSVGGNLVLDDGTPLNAIITHMPAGYAGIASDGGAALVANAGRFNTEFPDDYTGQRAKLLNNPRRTFGSISVRQSIGQMFEAYADAYYAENFGRAVFSNTTGVFYLPAAVNPFQQDVMISIPLGDLQGPATTKSENLSVVGGLIARLGGGWSVASELGWSRSTVTFRRRYPADFDAIDLAITDGSLDIFRDTNAFPIDVSAFPLPADIQFVGPLETIQRNYSLRASGPLFRLPGGALNLAALLERREEVAKPSLSNTLSVSFPGGQRFGYRPRRDQSVNSGYLELTAPIVSAANGITFVRELELQASLRHDRYQTRSPTPQTVGLFTLDNLAAALPAFVYTKAGVHSTDFTVAARWAPVRDLAFRASYATGFLPPTISQIVQTQSTSTFANPDPLRGNAPVGVVTTLDGGNPELEPESSKSLSFGAILTPRFVPGLRLSADYTRIRKSGEIGSPILDAMLADPDHFPGRVVRAAANLPGDPPGWAPPVIQLDISLINIARSRIEAWDFQADYELPTASLGTFHFFGIATLQTTLERQLRPDVAAFDTVGYFDGPLRWRGNLGLDWRLGGFRLSLAGQYYNSYSVRRGANPNNSTSNNAVRAQGAERIPSQFYADVGLAYEFGDRGGSALSNLRLSAGVQNVFDHRPPVVGAQTGGYSRYGDPRLRRFTLTLTKGLNF